MKRWVVVTGDFTPRGGMDRVNYFLVNYLSQQAGHRVEAVGHRFWSDMVESPSLGLHLVPRPLGSNFLGAWWLARTGRRIAQQSDQEGVTVVVNGANCPWPDVSWVHYVHAAYEPIKTEPGWRGYGARVQRAIYRHQEKIWLPRMRLLLANSERTKLDLMTHLGLAEKKIRVIYYGCQANEVPRRTQAFREEKRRALPFQPNRKLAIFVGALGDDRKGFETIYAVWEKEAKRADWDLDLLVVGSGAARRWWEEKARAAGVSQHMHFLGFRDDVLEWIGASDVMIHPARYEAYGLGVHEAICSGVPVIVSACAGVAERLQGPLRDLLLERPTDTEELTQKINHWRQQEKDFRQWTEAVGDRWRQQDGEQMARHMVEVCS